MAHENGEFRLGSQIKFDPVKERYIIEALDRLTKSNKLGPLISDLIRLAFDESETFRSRENIAMMLRRIDGLSPMTKQFYDQKNKEIAELKNRIDAIYNMVLQMYTLAMFGKRLGLESQALNSARAEFILEQQLLVMMNSLGMVYNRVAFESIKTNNVEKQGKDALEYIIKAYDNVVKEVEATMKPVSLNIPDITVTNSPLNIGVIGMASGTGAVEALGDSESTDNSELTDIEKAVNAESEEDSGRFKMDTVAVSTKEEDKAGEELDADALLAMFGNY